MFNDYEIQGDLAIIFLTHKNIKVMRCEVDVKEIPGLLSLNKVWHPIYTHGSYYACAGQKGKTIYLHRYIMNAPRGLMVDHLNNNTLDNRKINLRIVDNSLNMINKKGPQKNNTSGYLGVCWAKNENKWRARVNYRKTQVLNRFFDTPEEAAMATQQIRDYYKNISM